MRYPYVLAISFIVKQSISFSRLFSRVFLCQLSCILCSTSRDDTDDTTVRCLRRYLAVSDCVDKPTIFIYDLSTSKRRKTLYCTEVQSKDVVSLSFSSDHKYVLVLGGSPDYTLVVYLWEKGKIVTTLKPNMPNTWAAVNQVRGQAK